MEDLTTEVVDGDIEGLADAVLTGFDAIPVPSGVAPYETRPLAIALRSESGEIEGGLIGHSVWDWLYVNYLWVAKARRHGGCGKRLLDAAEREAERRGCLGVWLHTLSFQAPAFYERQGYERFGELDDFPKGHQRLFYRKRLAP